MSAGPAQAAQPRTLYGLEGLRGVAALAIVMRHSSDLFGVGLRSSHLAVDLFFVLSGYVLAHAYDQRLRAGFGAARFLKLRLLRLLPLHLLALALAAGSAVAWRYLDAAPTWRAWGLMRQVGANALFLPLPSGSAELFPLNMPVWSLLFELIANLAYALVAPWLTTRRLIAIVALGAIGLAAAAAGYGGLNIGWRWSDWPGGLARVAFSFPGGVLAFRLMQGRPRWETPSWPPLVALAALLCADAGDLQAGFEAAAALVLMPALVIAGAQARPRGLSLRLQAFAGAASYAVYVLHLPILSLAKWAAGRGAGVDLATLAPWSGLVTLAAIAGLAWLAHSLYDRPVRAWLSAMFARAGGRSGASPPAAADALLP